SREPDGRSRKSSPVPQGAPTDFTRVRDGTSQISICLGVVTTRLRPSGNAANWRKYQGVSIGSVAITFQEVVSHKATPLVLTKAKVGSARRNTGQLKAAGTDAVC